MLYFSNLISLPIIIIINYHIILNLLYFLIIILVKLINSILNFLNLLIFNFINLNYLFHQLITLFYDFYFPIVHLMK